MNATEMLSMLRFNALIEDTNVDYTDTVLLRELNHALTTKFERMVTDARCGYWLQRRVYTATVGNPIIRMPPRACGLSKVEIADSSASPIYRRLPQIREGHADLYSESVSAPSLGMPQHWVARGDRIHMLPSPAEAYSVRVTYYIRPSRLVPAQVSSTYGLITAANRTARTITVATVPQSISTGGVASSLVSPAIIDVVSPSGWHELQLVGEPATLASTTFTCLGAGDMQSISVGDYVRAAEQSEWPPIPESYHRCLVDVATVKVLIQRDFAQKAGNFGQDVSADLSRFTALISDRVQEEPQTPRAELPSLRRRW